MKTSILALIFPFLLLMFSCTGNPEPEKQFKSYKELSRHFKEIPNEYKTVPFWVWNDDVSREMIDEQLRDYKQKGFGGLFIHPRYGLITEYASPEWYDLVAYANRKAKKLGLDIWLYDENSFPSGFAGGHVPAEMPESYNQGQALRLHRQNILLPDSTLDYLMIQKLSDSVRDITSELDSYIGTKGNYFLFEKVYYPVSDWYAGFSYVDLIHPGVTEKFIELTMTGYEERIGEDFGKSVPGVFTDEPNIAPQGGRGLIRWTPDLFEQFEKRWGYSLEPNLVSLLDDTKDSPRIRHNYYQLLLELFIERWSKPWHSYTETHNLAWTGHYWEHGWPSPHHGPDNMAMYAWHQLPGIDMLFNNWDQRPDQFGNIRAVRELNSVANQLGQKRKLSETYGASGWELNFEDMKRNGDWEFVLGVNLMNQHLSYQTLKGDRKHDFPQSFSYHTPWWNEYPFLNDYFSRLSLALSSGEQVNRILVLEPTSSAWMKYSPEGENPDLTSIDNEFSTLLKLLESEQIEYDLGSENIIKDHGSVEGDVFIVGQRKYSFIVIPKFLMNLNSSTADLLETYLQNGGAVISLCQPPGYIDGAASDRCQTWSSDHPDHWLSLAGCNDPRLINYLRNEEFLVSEQEGGELLHMRRQLEDGQLLFLVNSSKSENCHIRLVSYGKDLVHLNLFNGELENYPCVYANEILSFDADIEPAGSILFYISQKDVKGKKSRKSRWTGSSGEAETGEIKVSLLDDNALNLDYCRLITDDDTSGLAYFYQVQTDLFKKHGFEGNPWVSASQFKTEILDRDTFPTGTGFTVEYPFFSDSRFESPDLRLVIERPELYTVRLNGELLERIEDSWWLDKSFGVYRIKGELKPGDNVISITADPMSVFCELEPVYLIGDFDAFALDKGWILSTSGERTLGSWKRQGMPFYSGRVEYSTNFVLSKTGPVILRMPEWEGSIATVYVNELKAGHIFMAPNELRIDDFVRKGDNTIRVEISGSLKNLLGPHHNVTESGIVTPWSFKYAPEIQPSGMDYDLLDYGLMEPFKIEYMEK